MMASNRGSSSGSPAWAWASHRAPRSPSAPSRANRPPSASGIRSTASNSEAKTPLNMAKRWASRSGALSLASPSPVNRPPTARAAMLTPSGATSVRATVHAVQRRTIPSRTTLAQPSAGVVPRATRARDQRGLGAAEMGWARLATGASRERVGRTGKRRSDWFAVLDEMRRDPGRCQGADGKQRRRSGAEGSWLDQHGRDANAALSDLGQRGYPSLVERWGDHRHEIVLSQAPSLDDEELGERQVAVGSHDGQTLQHLDQLPIRAVRGNRLQVRAGRDQTDVAALLQESARKRRGDGDRVLLRRIEPGFRRPPAALVQNPVHGSRGRPVWDVMKVEDDPDVGRWVLVELLDHQPSQARGGRPGDAIEAVARCVVADTSDVRRHMGGAAFEGAATGKGALRDSRFSQLDH